MPVSVILGVAAPAQLAERGRDTRRSESLSHQELIQARMLGGVGNARASAHLLLKSLRDERPLVDVREHFGERLAGDVLRDPHGAQLAHDAQAPAPLHIRRRARIRPSHPRIVQLFRFEQMFNDAVDFVGWMFAIGQAVAQFLFRQLAPREHPQGVGVGGHVGV